MELCCTTCWDLIGEKCWLRIKYHHYLYRAPHRGAPFLSFFPFVLPSPSSQTPSSKQVSAGVTHYSSLKGDENCQQVKPRIVRRQTAGKDVPPVIQGTTVQLAVKEQEILAELIRHWKKFSYFIWHRHKFFPFQAKKTPTEVCPWTPPNTSEQYPDSGVLTVQTHLTPFVCDCCCCW